MSNARILFRRNAADTAELKVIGRANADVDNSTGSAGDAKIEVERGVFRYGNSSTSALARSEWNTRVFVKDDNTVAKTSTKRNILLPFKKSV